MIASDVSDQAGSAFDPIAGGGACATAPAADQAGTASYRLDPAPAGGYTLMGSPTIIADINSPSPTSQLAARLLDVDAGRRRRDARRARALPAGDQLRHRERLARSSSSTRTGGSSRTGHIAKLELLPADQPYGRNSNGQAPITVSNLELRLPVLEQPGSLGGSCRSPAPKVVPSGYQLSRATTAGGYPRARRARRPLRVSLVPAYQQCTAPDRDARPAACVPVVLLTGPDVAQPDGRHARRERPAARTRSARSGSPRSSALRAPRRTRPT